MTLFYIRCVVAIVVFATFYSQARSIQTINTGGRSAERRRIGRRRICPHHPRKGHRSAAPSHPGIPGRPPPGHISPERRRAGRRRDNGGGVGVGGVGRLVSPVAHVGRHLPSQRATAGRGRGVQEPRIGTNLRSDRPGWSRRLLPGRDRPEDRRVQ